MTEIEWVYNLRMALQRCTICGDWAEWGKLHEHNPEGSQVNQIEELEEIFETDYSTHPLPVVTQEKLNGLYPDLA